MSALLAEGSGKGLDPSTLMLRAVEIVDSYWGDPWTRVLRAPAKELLKALNKRLVDLGFKRIGLTELARAIHLDETPDEMIGLIERVHEFSRTQRVQPVS